MAELLLTRGYTVVVDDVDAASLSAWKWTYLPGKKTGYAVRYVLVAGKRKVIYMHRQLLNAPDGVQVDHRDNNGLNNQRGNLRLATSQQNRANEQRRSAERYKGVRVRPSGRFEAYIKINRKIQHLGTFDVAEDAARAYDAKAVELFGQFAKTNLGWLTGLS